ncbi:type III-B CRISPR module RAMP protein Cmr4 [Yoonia vestfoldensis]|uniref:type III-B CRISPR module RAMP protein Cmr4 n=1 Tax=Yoonia vestfoldensis TaxID=245188 RepID=UPI0003648181|nr:type III-B CRISPR module RAMP protein Cmr4 [Yoonia vestfoldensis]
MTNRLITLVAETHVHSGEGQSRGVVDQPVARESVTCLPFVPGHSEKGALNANMPFSRHDRIDNVGSGAADEAQTMLKDAFRASFGDEGRFGTGRLLVGDARLILLPLRAEGYPYVLATCGLVLSRLARDLDFVGRENEAKTLRSKIDRLTRQQGVAHVPEQVTAVCGFEFDPVDVANHQELRAELARLLADILALPEALQIERVLAIFNDSDFTHFADVALPVRTRNVLDENKRSENIWYEETLPPDTVMCSWLGERGKVTVPDADGGTKEISPVDHVLDALKRGSSGLRYVQIGGNETVGQGWFQIFVGPRPAADDAEKPDAGAST